MWLTSQETASLGPFFVKKRHSRTKPRPFLLNFLYSHLGPPKMILLDIFALTLRINEKSSTRPPKIGGSATGQGARTLPVDPNCICDQVGRTECDGWRFGNGEPKCSKKVRVPHDPGLLYCSSGKGGKIIERCSSGIINFLIFCSSLEDTPIKKRCPIRLESKYIKKGGKLWNCQNWTKYAQVLGVSGGANKKMAVWGFEQSWRKLKSRK